MRDYFLVLVGASQRLVGSTRITCFDCIFFVEIVPSNFFGKQVDEGCQLEGNAGQIDTTLRYLRDPFGISFCIRRGSDEIPIEWRYMHLNRLARKHPSNRSRLASSFFISRIARE